MTKHAFALLLLLTMTCGAQSPATETTAGDRNGRFWESLSSTGKTYFIVGYSEAVRTASILPFLGEAAAKGGKVDDQGRQLVQETIDLMFPKNVIFADVIKGLDRLYAEPENLPLPISSAMRVLAMKFRSDKTEDIDAELRRLRILATKQ
jgi:hypothetical protein